MYIYTHIQTYIYIYIYTYTHTYIHIYIYRERESRPTSSSFRSLRSGLRPSLKALSASEITRSLGQRDSSYSRAGPAKLSVGRVGGGLGRVGEGLGREG